MDILSHPFGHSAGSCYLDPARLLMLAMKRVIRRAADGLWWLLKRQRQSESDLPEVPSPSVHGGLHLTDVYLATYLDGTRAPCWTDGDLINCPTVTVLVVQASHGSMCLSPRTILASLS